MNETRILRTKKESVTGNGEYLLTTIFLICALNLVLSRVRGSMTKNNGLWIG
jgi:hypothetical protein